MRRTVIAAMVLALSLGLATWAPAKGFPPKAACWQTDNNGDYLTLSLKSMGKVTTRDGATAIYSVNGVYIYYLGADYYFSIPITGTGYVDPAHGWFHSSVTGAFHDGLDTWVLGVETFTYPDGSGSEYVVFTGGSSGSSAWGYDDTFASTSCGNISLEARSVPPGALAQSLTARAAASPPLPRPEGRK